MDLQSQRVVPVLLGRALLYAGTWCSPSGTCSPGTQHVLVTSIECPILQAVDTLLFGKIRQTWIPLARFPAYKSIALELSLSL